MEKVYDEATTPPPIQVIQELAAKTQLQYVVLEKIFINAPFLYTLISQLEKKNPDWRKIANVYLPLTVLGTIYLYDKKPLLIQYHPELEVMELPAMRQEIMFLKQISAKA